jgi:carbon-monoxide dehydrogenase medium subunit
MDEEGRCRNLRVGIGAATETPQRLFEVEAQVQGEYLTNEIIQSVAEAYAQELEPLEDQRGSAWYRREMIRVFVRRALEEVRNGRR